MRVKSYKDLIVWQKAMELVEQVYIIVKKLPKEETYALSDQMRRSAVSIPSNIAEGQARNSTKEFVHFISIANGSKAELETQLYLCARIGYLSDADITKSISYIDEIGKMLKSLTTSLAVGGTLPLAGRVKSYSVSSVSRRLLKKSLPPIATHLTLLEFHP